MTPLSQMATLITSELGLFDTISFQLCEAYLSRNYATIWDKYPWGDATGYGYGEALAGVSLVDYPAGMDRIITLRASSSVDPNSSPPPPGNTDVQPPQPPTPTPQLSRFIDPVDSTFLIESEPSIFEDVGFVKYYEEVGDASRRLIRLYPIPSEGTSLIFFGKMICPGLSDTDDGASHIRNIDSALIAYATADMLQRQRQYGKAEIKRKEALELETSAWNLEQQQANKPRRTKATTVAGNSLAEMTDAVCMICGQWTPDYRLVIREFLRRNYQVLYDMFLWPESLVVVRVPYTTEQVIMPSYIDRILGIRGSDNMRMFPADAGLILDVTPSAFEAIGQSVSYTVLTPVAVSTLPSGTTQLVIASQSPVDTGKVAIRGEIIATGQELEEQIVLRGVTPVTTYNSYDIPLTIAKDITIGDVTVNALNDGRSLEVIPTYVRELKHQRVWFLPNPPDLTAVTSDTPDSLRGFYQCLVLGKRGIRPLLTDQDTPIITGAQQVLIAAAAADLFQKLEKPELAKAQQDKASASTEALRAKNTDQAASSPRFVPQVEPRAYLPGLAYGGVGWW